MLKKSYLKNYIKTYFWQGISIFLNILSLLIVVPLISDNKIVYGIYSICISLSIFLNYADLGFVSAGVKYAGECFAKNNKVEELKYYGFSGLILTVFVSLIFITFLIFSFSPQIIISDINNSEYLKIASSLLLIQAVFSYNIILQKYVVGIFQVRIEYFVFQRISIIANILKILSVFYFFRPGSSDIVGYYFFIKIIELLLLCAGVVIIQNRYGLRFTGFLKNLRFNKQIFIKTKNLAFSSLFVTLTWIIYFELDIIMIGKIFGAQEVAIFSLAFIFSQFLRTLSSVLFSPFQNRFNHFMGLDDMTGLKNILNNVIFLTMPIFIFGVTIVILLSEKIILSWAGIQYIDSVFVLILLGSCHIFSFINIPGANILVSLEKVKDMYIINLIVTSIFWIGIFLSFENLGMLSFPIFKLLGSIIFAVFYLKILLKVLNTSLKNFLKTIIFNFFVPTSFLISFIVLTKNFLPESKSYVNLIFVLSYSVLSFFVAIVLLLLSSKHYSFQFKSFLLKTIKEN